MYTIHFRFPDPEDELANEEEKAEARKETRRVTRNRGCCCLCVLLFLLVPLVVLTVLIEQGKLWQSEQTSNTSSNVI